VVEETIVNNGPEVASPMTAHQQIGVLELVTGSGAVVQGVLILLLLMSVLTWGIVVTKIFQVKRAKGQTTKFSDIFWSSRNLAQINESSQRLKSSPVAAVFSAGHKELSQIVRSGETDRDKVDFGDLESVDRALKRAKAEEITKLEKGTTFLATTASAAPFIGLFGTVWGIMNAFIGLSSVKSSSIQAVAPGISEALIATAIGLAAAIPAAIFYNYFMQQLRILSRSMDMFSAEFLNIARRHFLR
jgi:biopolymer transport protein TolQ